jgi:hypothetical protein
MWANSYQNQKIMSSTKQRRKGKTAKEYFWSVAGVLVILSTLDQALALLIGYESISGRLVEAVLTKVIGG